MSMTFKDKLRSYRQARAITKTELSRRLKVSLTYITMLEIGARIPSFERVEQIAKELSLSVEEKNDLLKSTFIDSLAPEQRLVYQNLIMKSSPTKISQEIMDAIQDPIAVKALLITHKNSKDIKESIRYMLEFLPELSPEKRQAILALCK